MCDSWAVIKINKLPQTALPRNGRFDNAVLVAFGPARTVAFEMDVCYSTIYCDVLDEFTNSDYRRKFQAIAVRVRE
jgi:hypothetical protein